jgi:glucuronokinase
MSAAPQRARVPARVGLVGNPSDGHGGAVLAAIVDAWVAEVVATTVPDVVRLRSRSAGDVEWSSRAALVADADARRTDAPHGIVLAALAALDDHLDGGLPGVEVTWSSGVPRSVGLAGSSAIAVAVIEAVGALAGGPVDPRRVAALALEAEVRWMGIPAGWQDRIVQAHRGAVLVDAGDMSTSIDGRAVPAVRRLPGFTLDAVIGWRPADRESSGAYHGALRQRATDRAVADGMLQLGDLARRAATSVAGGDVAGLRQLVDSSWRTRCGSAPLKPHHAQLVEAVRSTGVVATSPGSGGSVVALPADASAAATVVAALRAVGARSLAVTLG